MLGELRRMKNVFATCYQVDREKTSTKKVMKESHNDSLNLPHDICIMKIFFNDEDLLL